MRIGIVHFIGTSEVIRVTAEQADHLLELANGSRRSDFVKLADRAFRPSSVDYIKFTTGEPYDLTARPRSETAKPQLASGKKSLPQA